MPLKLTMKVSGWKKRKKDHNIVKDINRRHVRSFVDSIYLFSYFKGPLFDGYEMQ